MGSFSGQIWHIVALVALVVIAGAVYYLSTSVDFFSSAVMRAQEVEERTAMLEREVLSGLDQLGAVELDSRMFTSSEFTSLVDLRVQLEAPELVRPNPFAPLENLDDE